MTNEENPEITTEEKGDEVAQEEEVIIEEEEKPTPDELEKLKIENASLKRDLKKFSKKEKQEVENKTTDDLDYGQKAFLKTYDIKGADELELVKSWIKRTGDDLDVLVEDDIFTAKLGKLREAKRTSEAIPKSTRRSTVPAQDDVPYWIAKIESGESEVNDIKDIDLRRKVVNAQIDKQRIGSRFYNS